MDVVLLRWPLERVRRDELARADRPRLLLVEAGAAPPVVDSPLEDWIRLPVCFCMPLRSSIHSGFPGLNWHGHLLVELGGVSLSL